MSAGFPTHITAMPGCTIVPDDMQVEVSWPHRSRLCADHNKTTCDGCPDPNMLLIERPDGSDDHLAAVVAYCVDQVHEAIEWIRIDGQRFADPHPSGDFGFEMLTSELTALLLRYRAEFPASAAVKDGE